MDNPVIKVRSGPIDSGRVAHAAMFTMKKLVQSLRERHGNDGLVVEAVSAHLWTFCLYHPEAGVQLNEFLKTRVPEKK